jgi:hypothetical protein
MMILVRTIELSAEVTNGDFDKVMMRDDASLKLVHEFRDQTNKQTKTNKQKNGGVAHNVKNSSPTARTRSCVTM